MNTYTPHFENMFLSSSFALKEHYIFALLVIPVIDKQLFFCLAPYSEHMFPSSWKRGQTQLSKRGTYSVPQNG